MPRGDGTGPMGFGPMTGRAAGYCAEYAAPGFFNPVAGCGRGMGRGRGRGFGMGMAWRHGRAGMSYPAAAYAVPYAPATSPQNEVEALKNQANYFSETLEQINRRIAELEAEKK